MGFSKYSFETAASIGLVDGLLMDVARRAQVPPSKHEDAVSHYQGLSRHVDRQGSPLEGRVIEIYPSGSFAIHAATYSRIRLGQHDVDAVLELDLPAETDPAVMLDWLHEAIKGEPGSYYYDFKIERNSRCITVTYSDGVTVDLMPVVRIDGGPDRSALLFHHKPETGERLRKEVNPAAFVKHFNEHIASSDSFAVLYRTRRLLLDGTLVEKAETQPMPSHLPIEEKSPRLIAIQLIKRFAQVQYRKRSKNLRRPPSIITAALALDAGPMTDSLFAEVKAVALRIRGELYSSELNGRPVQVLNPAHPADIFTDRWPENLQTQRLWHDDLGRLIASLDKMEGNSFDATEAKKALSELFGETLADHALVEHFRGQNEAARHNQIGFTKVGALVSTAAIATPSIITPARANTNMGGALDDIDY